jgi:ribosome biogenesis protein BRX1
MLTRLILTCPPPVQIVEKDPLVPSGPPQTSLVEIGPRFVMTPIRIFEGSFSGATVFENAGECTFVPILRCSGDLDGLSRPLASPHILTLLCRLVLAEFVTPAALRATTKREAGAKYRDRKMAERTQDSRREERRLDEPELAVGKVFA